MVELFIILVRNLNKLNFRYNTLNENKDLYLPTLLNKNGFKFFFYANEHEPKHIHIMKSDGFAKVELETLKVV